MEQQQHVQTGWESFRSIDATLK